MIKHVTSKNNTAVKQSAFLMRGGDFDADGTVANLFDRTPDSVFARRNDLDLNPTTFPGPGLSLTAATFAIPHFTAVHSTSGTSDCSGSTLATPITGDRGGRVIYDLRDIGPGQSKTVKVTYRKQ